MKKTNKLEKTSPKAVPFFGIVKQFAFLNDLPFFLYNDQLKAIGYYKQSLQARK